MKLDMYLIWSIYYGLGVLTLIYLQLSIVYPNRGYIYFFFGYQIVFIILDLIFIGNIVDMLSQIEQLYQQAIRFIFGLFRFNYGNTGNEEESPKSDSTEYKAQNHVFMEGNVSIEYFLNSSDQIDLRTLIFHKNSHQILKRQKDYEDKGGDMSDLRTLKFLISQSLSTEWCRDKKQMNSIYVETLETGKYLPNIAKLQQAATQTSCVSLSKREIKEMQINIILNSLPDNQATQPEQVKMIYKYYDYRNN